MVVTVTAPSVRSPDSACSTPSSVTGTDTATLAVGCFLAALARRPGGEVVAALLVTDELLDEARDQLAARDAEVLAGIDRTVGGEVAHGETMPQRPLTVARGRSRLRPGRAGSTLAQGGDGGQGTGGELADHGDHHVLLEPVERHPQQAR